jgi:hypothetical protein
MKKLFLGWTNIRWFFSELVKMYSSKPSYFSKKRVESGVAFTIAQAGMIFFLCTKYNELEMSEFLWWAAAEFAVAGYMINAIQKEKIMVNSSQSESNDPSDSP